MKKNGLSLVVAAAAVTFCLSAASPTSHSEEVAMAKCTKEDTSCKVDSEDTSDVNCKSCKNSDQSDASSQVKTVRKSAAQKVLEGN